MSAPGAGHEFPSQEVSWQKRDVLLFANSIGVKVDELHFLYVRFLFDWYLSALISDTLLGVAPELRCFPDLPPDSLYVTNRGTLHGSTLTCC